MQALIAREPQIANNMTLIMTKKKEEITDAEIRKIGRVTGTLAFYTSIFIAGVILCVSVLGILLLWATFAAFTNDPWWFWNGVR